MSKHTKGAWRYLQSRIAGEFVIKIDTHPDLAIEIASGIDTEANAKRIVDCVNACDGLPNDALDGGWTAQGSSAYAKKLEITNAELLDALDYAIRDLELRASFRQGDDQGLVAIGRGAYEQAKKAISKARGEA